MAESEKHKIGHGYMERMAILGARELGAAFFTQSNVAQYGYGITPTQHVEPRVLHSEEAPAREEAPPSQIEEYVKPVEHERQGPEQEPRELERDV